MTTREWTPEEIAAMPGLVKRYKNEHEHFQLMSRIFDVLHARRMILYEEFGCEIIDKTANALRYLSDDPIDVEMELKMKKKLPDYDGMVKRINDRLQVLLEPIFQKQEGGSCTISF